MTRKISETDLMFALTHGEFENSRYQFGTSSWGGGRRYLLCAFTELVIAMMSSAHVRRDDKSSNVAKWDLGRASMAVTRA
ncbi:MAG: ORF6N domain-containing protein [Planctomycetes bacterium]|nr:ORF6N domain-containing protein [Planctomycetota bacterium]